MTKKEEGSNLNNIHAYLKHCVDNNVICSVGTAPMSWVCVVDNSYHLTHALNIRPAVAQGINRTN